MVDFPSLLLPTSRGPIRDVAWAVRASLAATICIVLHSLMLAFRSEQGLKTSFVAFLVRVFVTGPWQAMPPASIVFAALRSSRWIRKQQSHGPLEWGSLLVWQVTRFWTILEALHYLHYRVTLRSLNRRRLLPPRREVPGRRIETFKRILRELELVALEGTPAPISSVNSQPKDLGRSRNYSGLLTRSTDNLKPLQRSGSKSSSGKFFGREPSAECLLRLWQSEDDSNSDKDARALALKRADISGWFHGASVFDMGKGNVREWLAEYFFEGLKPREIPVSARAELEEMICFLLDWLGYPEMRDFYNHRVRCQRVSQDPIAALHRPLFFYGVTSWVLPALTEVLCQSMGFSKYTSGVIHYWRRPARQSPDGQKLLASPIVFCHGLGIGVLPYIQFIRDLGRSGSEMFLLDLPHISLRQSSDVPSPRETVACIVDMLAAWGHVEGHFVGHSFGTFVVSWTLRNSQVVKTATLLDPVCFLLVKHDILSNALYRVHDDPIMVALTYFVFRELYVAHTLQRSLYWQHAELPVDKVHRPLLVLLSGQDAIVPAHSVNRLLRAEEMRRQELLKKHAVQSRVAGVTVGKLNAASAVDLSGLRSFHDTELRVAGAPLEVLWFPDLEHTGFVASREACSKLLKACSSLHRQAEGLS